MKVVKGWWAVVRLLGNVLVGVYIYLLLFDSLPLYILRACMFLYIPNSFGVDSLDESV